MLGHVFLQFAKVGVVVEEADNAAEEFGHEQDVFLQGADIQQSEVGSLVYGPDAALGFAGTCHHCADLLGEDSIGGRVERGIHQSLARELKIDRVFDGQGG